ncbi:MAG: YggS family pyridoxal phosphate-dependent enzyme [Bacteroidetes bacterium]|nr:YggS family pyridoxal phosphate-dependent enzyme [Bacteroidota bacterium]
MIGQEDFQNLLSEFSSRGVKLIAVSKTKSNEEIMQIYNRGHKIFGENKVQEMVGKQAELPEDIQWHMIGNLQSNKVKHIAPFISLIHSVTSFKLLNVIDNQAYENDRVIDCLLQVKIAAEDTKSGFSKEALLTLLLSEEYKALKHVRIIGLMGMASFASDEGIVRREFEDLNNLFQNIRREFFSNDEQFRQLSIGMSGDYIVAIEEGSTMVRIGSLIFGERHYSSS